MRESGIISNLNEERTMESAGVKEVEVGEQASIDCGAALTDALDSTVLLNCQSVVDGPVFPASQSLSTVAGRITYNWMIEGGRLIVRVFNNSEVDVKVKVV